MAIPTYDECMLPLLEILSDGQDHRLRDVTRAVADRLQVPEGEREAMLPSGAQTVIANRVGWAKTYLKKAGLLDNPTRGTARITELGTKVIDERPPRIDAAFLMQFSPFREFKESTSPPLAAQDVAETTSTPEESLEAAYRVLHEELALEVAERVKSCSPEFFERLVVELLVRMGYGGSLADAGQAIGKSGDGGIDGIIKEDRLGLDVVCIQAKRWKDTVGRPVVQAFAGSMEGQRAKKGVLITTAAFSQEAKDYVNRIERKIVLIDGRQLAELMIEHDLGVSRSREFILKKIDLDFFETEEV